MLSILNSQIYSNYSHNRSVFNMTHDALTDVLQISPEKALEFDATYESDLATFRLTPAYIAYFKIRKSGKTAKHTAIVMKLVDYDPERFENVYNEDLK